jgi:hypothetical protein
VRLNPSNDLSVDTVTLDMLNLNDLPSTSMLPMAYETELHACALENSDPLSMPDMLRLLRLFNNASCVHL